MRKVENVMFMEDPEDLQDVFDELGNLHSDEWEKESEVCYVDKEVILSDSYYKDFARDPRMEVDWITEEDVVTADSGLNEVMYITSLKTKEFYYLKVIKKDGLLVRLIGIPQNHGEIMREVIRRQGKGGK